MSKRFTLWSSVEMWSREEIENAIEEAQAEYPGDTEGEAYNVVVEDNGYYFDDTKSEHGENYCVYLNGLMLYVCAAEIENPLAKDMLIHWLYNDNKGSIKFFEMVSGCKLPKTYKARVEFINQLTADEIHLMAI